MPILQTNRIPDYMDLDLTFTANPVTGDVPILIGTEAIKRSLKNLILTNFWERPFRSYLGSNVTRQLFENINSLTANLLQAAIVEVIKNFEPRVDVSKVTAVPDPDNNRYGLKLEFFIINQTSPITINFFLERIR